MKIKTGIGQDSHAFESNSDKPLILAGVKFANAKSLRGNSDADVVLHSLTNAISSVTGKNILGEIADDLCQQGIEDSAEYLKCALIDLDEWQIEHIAISLECLEPKISPQIKKMKESIAEQCNITTSDVGITATTGEGLTAFGRGEGIQALTIITVSKA
ncbi:MAG: 2-C-methyl-D-erythritol 2,4-cyclodiphosphate synthase [Gammaproteobacteria bacterium]|nr:2-C-methyl-D-erythritol 2,4-cyclodiphosphate synthase [Gammaproteobacteria bacterium]